MNNKINSLYTAITSVKERYPDEQLKVYLVLNPASKANPIDEYFKQEVWKEDSSETVEARPLWNGTLYQDWLAVAPYVAQIPYNHAFIRWLEASQDKDWGFIVLSVYPFKTVYQHLQSLTQIWVEEGRHAFFKFWQPSLSFQIFEALPNQMLHELMGACHAFLTVKQTVINPIISNTFILRTFPWWTIPESMLQMFFLNDPALFIKNMMTLINDHRSDLIDRYGDSILQAKLKAYHRQFIQKRHNLAPDYNLVINFLEG